MIPEGGLRLTITTPSCLSRPTLPWMRHFRPAPSPALHLHNVSLDAGRLLSLLAQIQGARVILEIGKLGGCSTI
jgi:hypothetical protein